MTINPLISDWNTLKGAIGLFGGTFDPVQNAHLGIADACLLSGKVGSVVFIPAKQNPLKASDPGASGEDRLSMLKLALDGKLQCYVSDIELVRADEPSYTITTVREIRRLLSCGQKLVFIMGDDCLPAFHKWHQVHELLELLDGFVIYPRAGVDLDLSKVQEALSPEESRKLLHNRLDAPVIPISATDIRKQIQQHGRVTGLVPQKVEEYIITHQLYT